MTNKRSLTQEPTNSHDKHNGHVSCVCLSVWYRVWH